MVEEQRETWGLFQRSHGFHYQHRLREMGLVRGHRTMCMPHDFTAKSSGRMFAHGNGDRKAEQLYRNMVKVNAWDPQDTVKHTHHGGIFGLDFTPDGCILGAACENRSLLLFDPLSGKLTHSVDGAHTDCANAIKFLDNRMLASCSDDMTVKLWDVRNLRQSFRTMRAHNNWVKNIEFIQEKGLLISSAFDGNVFSWDINDGVSEPKRLFFTPGLMRMRLTPDASKMVLSTHWGYLLAIHNLDLNHLPTDLSGFKPNMYWLMIKSRTQFSTSGDHACRFTAERNRTEMVLDFPDECDPENISSLTPHPHGWCLASRSNNHDNRSEWTCVHDLQLPTVEQLIESGEIMDEDHSDVMHCESMSLNNDPSASSSDNQPRPHSVGPHTDIIRLEGAPFLERSRRLRMPATDQLITLSVPAQPWQSNDTSDDSDAEVDETPISNVQAQRQRLLNRRRRARARITLASGSGGVTGGRVNRSATRNSAVQLSINMSGRIQLNSGWTSEEPRAFFIRTGMPDNHRTIVVVGGQSTDFPSTSANIESPSVYIPKTYKRLVYYSEEPRVGRGFIKEQAWSSDGRVLASPHAFGVRLLAFSPSCQELCDVSPPCNREAKAMSEVAFSTPHSSVVLCTKFSPTHCLLATGCLKGRVVFHHPYFDS